MQHGAGNPPASREANRSGSKSGGSKSSGSKRPSSLLLAVLTEREQGLMLRPALAGQIQTLADLARGGQRFLNRQRGSGTRALLDELLREAGLRPAMIRGYQDEEFTHLAVAASIAGGGADAGFGIRAAAERFGLAFVPLARETYYLASRADGAVAVSLSRIAAWLRDAAFRTLCQDLPGYDTTHAGEESLFEPPRRPRGRPRGSGTG
jgi:molybdate-binding protein